MEAEIASALELVENLSIKSSDSGLSEDTCWALFGGPCPDALKKFKINKRDEENDEDDDKVKIAVIPSEIFNNTSDDKVEKVQPHLLLSTNAENVSTTAENVENNKKMLSKIELLDSNVPEENFSVSPELKITNQIKSINENAQKKNDLVSNSKTSDTQEINDLDETEKFAEKRDTALSKDPDKSNSNQHQIVESDTSKLIIINSSKSIQTTSSSTTLDAVSSISNKNNSIYSSSSCCCRRRCCKDRKYKINIFKDETSKGSISSDHQQINYLKIKSFNPDPSPIMKTKRMQTSEITFPCHYYYGNKSSFKVKANVNNDNNFTNSSTTTTNSSQTASYAETENYPSSSSSAAAAAAGAECLKKSLKTAIAKRYTVKDVVNKFESNQLGVLNKNFNQRNIICNCCNKIKKR